MRACTRCDIVLHISSLIAVATFMAHFWGLVWQPGTVAGYVYVLWGVAGACAVFSIYSGMIRSARSEEEGARKGIPIAAAVIGCLVLLGLTMSAVWLIVPVALYGT